MQSSCLQCMIHQWSRYELKPVRVTGLPGWVWLFVLEGAATVIFGIALRVTARPLAFQHLCSQGSLIGWHWSEASSCFIF